MKLIKDTIYESFKPIKVTISIETREEYDAILRANEGLCVEDIDINHDWSEREIWVSVLETVAEGLE